MTSRKFLAGETMSFSKAFPDVQSIRVDVRHHGDMNPAHQSVDRFDAGSLNPTIRCVNPKCQQGGYNIEFTLSELLRSRSTSHSLRWHCDGHEGTPKGRRKGNPCMNFADIEFTVSYK